MIGIEVLVALLISKHWVGPTRTKVVRADESPWRVDGYNFGRFSVNNVNGTRTAAAVGGQRITVRVVRFWNRIPESCERRL